MSSSFALAVQAAHQAAGQQHYPEATLYVVATPIGNLADITLRALEVLQRVDTIACEDTRHTAALLGQYGLHKPLLALHQHNEAQAAQTVVERLAQGQRVAYVSDAGTPAVSDPGARLVRAVQAAGHRVVPLPGASSVTTLLSASGAGELGFDFVGFLPTKTTERQRAVQALATRAQALVLLEAPHRIHDLAQALAVLGTRPVTVGRELTKQFEQIVTLACADLPAWLAADAHRVKGEFALVLHPLAPATDEDADALTEREQHTLRLLLAELPTKTAVKLAVDILGRPRNVLYAAALAQQSPPDESNAAD